MQINVDQTETSAKLADQDALPGERQLSILNLLREHGRVIAADLASRFAVSEDSIRRDLRDLAARGLCRRVYGGALPLVLDASSLNQRQERRIDNKKRLAQCAVGLVRAGQVLFMDAGSTNSAIADALPESTGLTVLTNAPDIAQRLMHKRGIDVYLIGGRMDARVGQACGAQTVDDIRRLRADVCFPGACAVDAQTGLWSMTSEESLIKRAMIECSGSTAVVVTNEKLGAVAVSLVAPLRDIDQLVVEHDASAELCGAYEEQGVELHRAKAE